MDIKEVLNLPYDTEVQTKSGVSYRIILTSEGITLGRGGCAVTITKELVEAEYELVRKKLNFFEAMRLVDEGKVVENNECIYKKDAIGRLTCKEKAYQEEGFNASGICSEEINCDWYEVIE